jgi:hypothetical protein
MDLVSSSDDEQEGVDAQAAGPSGGRPPPSPKVSAFPARPSSGNFSPGSIAEYNSVFSKTFSLGVKRGDKGKTSKNVVASVVPSAGQKVKVNVKVPSTSCR